METAHLNVHGRGILARRLWRRRAELLRAVAETEEDLQWLAEDREIEPEDEAQQEREARLLVLLGERDRREIEDIDAAIRRIQQGTYGVCEACGRPIPLRRLRALPAARYCIDCEQVRAHSDAERWP
jgi:DnaK suppressor protein